VREGDILTLEQKHFFDLCVYIYRYRDMDVCTCKINMFIYIDDIYTYIDTFMYKYFCVHICREGKRDICMYMYIYIYI